MPYLPTLLVFPGVSKFFIKSLGFSECLLGDFRRLFLGIVFNVIIRFFHQSHNTVHFGMLFTLKQWIFSSLKHDPVPRENKLYCFYVKNPPKRIALWDRENSQCKDFNTSPDFCTLRVGRYVMHSFVFPCIL